MKVKYLNNRKKKRHPNRIIRKGVYSVKYWDNTGWTYYTFGFFGHIFTLTTFKNG